MKALDCCGEERQAGKQSGRERNADGGSGRERDGAEAVQTE